jgi:RimJ/RimL family protein N-acetyltransferase
MRTILETPRLALREMSLDDLDFIATMLADPLVMRFYPQTYSREEAAAWIERQMDRYARHGSGLWLALDRTTGEPMGQVGLLRQMVDGVEEPEVGYLLYHAYWSRGYATEAAGAVRDWAFEVRGEPHVISLIRPENVPSQAVALRLGMKPERETLFHDLRHLVFVLRRPSSEIVQPGTPR